MSKISEKDALNIAKEVIVSEVSAINNLKKTLDKELYLFCKKIFYSKGKLIIIGVGKSGHIGKKLAATFSSTGTSSFFIPTPAKFSPSILIILSLFLSPANLDGPPSITSTIVSVSL